MPSLSGRPLFGRLPVRWRWEALWLVASVGGGYSVLFVLF